MDPITQSVLGAALAQSVARPKDLRRAGFAGALGGFLPDADVLIRWPSDPLLFLDYHRQFTHSLAFIPIGGALTAALCALLFRGKAQVRQLLLPATIGITEQTTSVTSWCRGFILGFNWNKSIVKETLEPDAIEALIDIAQIADAQSSGDAPESQERALVELEEYLRVCAQLIYEAVRSSIAQNPTTR